MITVSTKGGIKKKAVMEVGRMIIKRARTRIDCDFQSPMTNAQ